MSARSYTLAQDVLKEAKRIASRLPSDGEVLGRGGLIADIAACQQALDALREAFGVKGAL